MSTTTDTTTPGADMSGPGGGRGGDGSGAGGNGTGGGGAHGGDGGSGVRGGDGRGGDAPASKDPYIRGTDETVLLDLRELRAQEAADKAAREAAAAGSSGESGAPAATGAELERYHGSHRRDAVLYADGGTAIPLDRVREVCHDLRQPVAAILMLASAAEMRPDVPERVRDVLQEIMSQTEEISATVRQFLDDAKQGVDGLGEPVPCNVAGLAAQAVERWRATFDGDLALAAAEEPLHVTVDPVLFKRALGNVLSNGTRAAGGSGRVQVTVRRFETAEGERAVIEVDDSGPGFGNIPAGHGLGLAVVRRTMEAAGGSVEFARGPLGGALVRLVLPVTPIRPLSADDELTKTFHGEMSLTQLAAQLAAGRRHPALAGFEDDIDEDFDDDDPDEHFAASPAADPHSLTGGHAFMTRLSAWPEPMAISGAPEQLAIGGTAGAANPFGARAAERGVIAGAPTASTPNANAPVADAPTPGAPTPGADNRSYFGLPVQPSLPTQQSVPAAPVQAQTQTQTRAQAQAQAPEPMSDDRGFFGVASRKNESPDPAATGYFGLPLKDTTAPAELPPAPHTRLYGGPADISAHPVPTGLRSAHRPGTPTPQAPSEITAAAHPGRPTAPVPPRTSIETAAAQAAAKARALAAFPTGSAPTSGAAPQTLAEALAESAAARQDPAAQPSAAPAVSAAPAPIPAPHAPAASAGPSAADSRSSATPAAPQPPAASAAQPTPAAHPFAAPVPPQTSIETAAAQAAPAAPTDFPAPTFEPGDTQPLHIIPTGQDDTALASIQLPSQANLTHPPRIPSSALQPIASVQLSLLPGGAF